MNDDVVVGDLGTEIEILRMREVIALVKLSRSTIYKLIGLGFFPAPIKLVQDGKAIGFIKSEIEKYLRDRAKNK